MPSWIELQHFLAHGSREHAARFDADLEHLHRVTTRLRDWPELAVLAFDHRVQFEELALADGRSDGAIDAQARERIARFKRLVAAGGQRGASASTGFGVIVDDRYGEDVLPMLTGGAGWIARPVEQPGSRPLAFEGGADVALTLREWPTEHVAKCLVLFHPDDDEATRTAQLERLGALQVACVATDRELLIEVIPPREMASGDDDLARALDAIYAAGVRPDWWKLPPPGSDAAWDRIAESIARHDPHCRGVLLLGLEASEDALARSFAMAAPHAICRGFAVGRSIFAPAAAAWFAGSASDDEVVADIAARYSRLVALWRKARDASPTGARRNTSSSIGLKDTA
jgi:5-dehydro-2-deoxygluconokinase